jgi:predicted esterase
MTITGGDGPHAGQALVGAGPAWGQAAGALILVHGRGADAAGMLGIAPHVASADIACVAPQAAGHSWYPNRFLEPAIRNEPYLSSALSILEDLVDKLLLAGIPPSRIALLGFSQGACLALEFIARRGTPLGAVIGLSGGLIGEHIPLLDQSAVLAGMPVLLGCASRDGHIPLQRVHDSAEAFRRLGAEVTERIYEGSNHGINQDEVSLAKAMLTAMIAKS